MHDSRVIASWELASRIRKRRLELKLDMRTVAARFGFSRAYWSAVENDRTILAESRFAEVLELLEFDQAEREELVELRTAARDLRGWWDDYHDILSDDLLRFYGLEAGARSLRCYEAILVPGMLQSNSYTMELIESFPANRPADYARLLEVRMLRQEHAFSRKSFHLTAVIGEAALHQVIVADDTLRDQLLHLVALAESNPDSIEVHILPFTTPPRGAAGASTIHLLDFDSAYLPPIAASEMAFTFSLIDKKETVSFFALCYEEALEVALGQAESLELIRRRVTDLDEL